MNEYLYDKKVQEVLVEECYKCHGFVAGRCSCVYETTVTFTEKTGAELWYQVDEYKDTQDREEAAYGSGWETIQQKRREEARVARQKAANKERYAKQKERNEAVKQAVGKTVWYRGSRGVVASVKGAKVTVRMEDTGNEYQVGYTVWKYYL